MEESIFDALPDVVKPDSFKSISPKKYLQGLPEALGSSFLAYRGSLTYPPCHRGVRWLVAEQTFKIGTDKVGISFLLK